MIRSCITLLFLISLLLVSCQQEDPPNFILIMADDLGYNDLGCYGSEIIQTPNIDQLARNGIRFTDYHSNGTVCSPTRAALLTGRYQQRAGLEAVVTAVEYRHAGLSSEEFTLAEALKELGYATGIAGKWHLGYDTLFSPVNQGFDHFRGYVSGNVDYHSHIDQAGVYDWWDNKEFIEEPGYVTDLVTRTSVEFIRDHRNDPFFLYVAHEAPHYPYQGRNDPADRTVGGEFDSHGSRPDREQAYQEMIGAMDEGIGEILQTLEELDLQGNTLVIFCSDNGATRVGSNSPFRDFKGTVWEGGHRVPAIVSWPGMIEPGITAETVISMDLFPTLVSIASAGTGIEGISSPELDGMDLGKLLLQNGTLPDRDLFWRYRGQSAVRSGPWKLLHIRSEEFLFNLEQDPGEKNNLIDQDPEELEKLRALLKEWESEMDRYPVRTE